MHRINKFLVLEKTELFFSRLKYEAPIVRTYT
jgi:hypothetical protein